MSRRFVAGRSVRGALSTAFRASTSLVAIMVGAPLLLGIGDRGVAGHCRFVIITALCPRAL